MRWSRRRFIRSIYRSSFTIVAEQIVASCASQHPGLALAALLQSPSRPAAHFVDVAADAGLNVPIVCGKPEQKDFLLEMTGCGVAFYDYDHDGWLDIFFVNGSAFDFDDATPRAGNRLFHNNRDGTFTDITVKAGLTRSGWGQGCCIGDYDNDGFDDLFVTYWGQNVLYRNQGDGTFVDVTEEAGLGTDSRHRQWNTGCCFLDYDRDGYLDLFVARYIQFDPQEDPGRGGSKYCQLNGVSTPCGPRGFNGGTNLLYRNRGDGTFEDVTMKAGVDRPKGPETASFVDKDWRPRGSYGFAAVAADFDNDGWPDIYVACDSAPSLLYRNNQDGTFREMGVEAGCAYNEDGVEQGGMGVGVGDYDNDGWLDIVKTNFSDDTSSLYRNVGDNLFEDATYKSGIGANTRFLGWGAGFVDVNNDGRQDIFLANGHIYPEIHQWFPRLKYKERKILYKNLANGRFADISLQAGPGLLLEKSSRGCAFGDFDNDGDVDIVVSNINDLPTLLRNDGTSGGHWVKVKCIGTVSNRSAIGARVRVVVGAHSQIDEVRSGSSYISQNDLRLHFGLGSARTIDQLEIRWPSGTIESFENLAADRIYYLEEGVGKVRTSGPGAQPRSKNPPSP